jgi:hypothetical protein
MGLCPRFAQARRSVGYRSRTGPAQDVRVVSVTTWNRLYAAVKAGARSIDATTRPSSHGSKPRVARGELLRGRIGGIMTGLDAPDGRARRV